MMDVLELLNNDLSYIYPETGAMLLFAFFALITIFGKGQKINSVLFIASVLILLVLNIYQCIDLYNDQPIYTFYDQIIVSSQRSFYKILICIVVVFYWIYTKLASWYTNESDELNLTIISQLFGAFVVVQAGSYITLFLGIEIVSITSYIITYLGNSEKAKVAATKYFLFGAFSSALMIYGISWIYGITNSILINDYEKANIQLFDHSFVWLSVVCFYSGLFFKISAVPFHLWADDVYKGLTNNLLSLVTLIPKLVGFVALFHVVQNFQFYTEFGKISEHYIYVISILTMVVANLIALRQDNFRSLVAFSSIAQSGLMLSMVPLMKQDVFLFYFSIYLVANVALLFVYDLLVQSQHDTNLDTISGLGSYKPILAVLLTIVIGSLIGIPVFVGFIGKLLIIQNLIEGFNINSLKTWVGIVVIITTLLSLFYYLKLPYYLFVKKYNNSSIVKITSFQLLFSAFLVVPLVIGFFSFDWLLQLIQSFN